MKDITALIDEVLALSEKATPGPWEVDACPENFGFPDHDSPTGFRKADAELVCTFRTSAPVIARALKIAIEALEFIKKNSWDDLAQTHTAVAYDADDALKAIAKLGGEP